MLTTTISTGIPLGSSITVCNRRLAGLCWSYSRLAVPVPPIDYDYKADVLADTLKVVQQQHPELLDIVQAGNLVVYKRPARYTERRTDGYQEPQLLFILGTAHVSSSSVQEVQRVVAAVQPQCVVLELCRSRVGVLQASNPPTRQQPQYGSSTTTSTSGTTVGELPIGSSSSSSNNRGSNGSHSSDMGVSTSPQQSPAAANLLSLTGDNFLSAVSRSAQLGGSAGLVLRLLLAGQASKAAGQLGVKLGEEFRAAARAAEAVKASLVLGDRPIEITLERAWAALTWQRRLKLLHLLLLAWLGTSQQQEVLTQDTVERLRSDDTISTFFKQLSRQYPELVSPLVHERDLYLAWSLKRSKAVNGANVVVGVVGKGHLRGIVYAMKHSQKMPLRFADLVGGKNKKKSRQELMTAAAKRISLELLFGAGLYAAWLAVSRGMSS